MSKHRRSQQPSAAAPEASWAHSVNAAAAVVTHSIDSSNAPITAAATTERSWSWAIAALTHAVDSDRKCNVSIADSIALPADRDVARTVSSSRKSAVAASSRVLWLTTHKSGAVARKRLKHVRTDAFPAAEISERFVQLASRWAVLDSSMSSNARPPYIAVLVLHNGERQLLEPAAFQTWLDTLEAHGPVDVQQRDDSAATEAACVAGLEAYIPPARGAAPSFITATYSSTVMTAPVSTSSTTTSSVDVAYRDTYCVPTNPSTIHQTTDAALPLQTSRLRNEVERATLAVVDALQRSTSSGVERATLEFVVDCEHRLWLTHISRIAVASERHDDDAMISKSKSDHSNSAVTIGLRKQSLPSLHSAANSSSDVSAAVGTKCRGEFCVMSPAQLPGLFQVVDSSDSSSTDASSSSLLPDTGERFKIGAGSVQLARAEIRFLLDDGGIDSSDAARRARALQWHEADTVLRAELGRSHPTQFYRSVLVCANCYRVYTALQRARDCGFRAPGGTTPRGVGSSTMIKPSRSAAALSTTTTRQNSTKTSSTADVPLARAAMGSDVLRPEYEDVGSLRPPSSSSCSSSRSERASLPSLQLPASSAAAVLPRAKRSKALAGPAVSNNNTSSNNQAPNTSYDNDAVDRSSSAAAAALATELTQTRARLAASELQRQQLEQRCVQTQTQCTSMLAEKDDAMRKQRLEFELASSCAKQRQYETHRDANASTGTADEMRKLLETIDSLSAQLSALEATRDRDATAQTQTQQREIKRLHERYQIEMEALRLEVHAANERAEAAQQERLTAQHAAQVAAAQARSAHAALEDLTTTTLKPLEATNRRLERQVAELQTATPKPSRLPNSSSDSSSDSAPTTHETHMGHKVAYLQAQLASELTCKEELGHHLANVTAALEAAKRDKKQALAAQDDAFQRQLARVESGFAAERDVFAAQHAAQQNKVATLQANAADLVQDVAMWQSKEANARLALDKLADESVRHARQVADLEAQIETLLEQQCRLDGSGTSAKAASDETQRMQTDALLRRLDNERQYLTNQLDAEADARVRSQQQTAELEQTVAALRTQLEQITADAAAARAAATTELQRTERQARDAITTLDASKQLLATQLHDVQTKAAAARDQALLDRDELEKLRIDANELRAQLAATNDALTRERASGESASARSSQALALARDSLRAVETEAARRVQRVESECALLVTQLADAQAELLVVEDRRSADAAALKRQHAHARLALVAWAGWSRHCSVVRARAFERLKQQARQQTLCTTLERDHSIATNALDEQLRRAFMDKCDELTQRLHDERVAAEQQLHVRYRAECDALREQLTREFKQQQLDAAQAHASELDALRDAHDKATAARAANATDTIADFQLRCKEAETSHMATSAALAETREQCTHLQAEVERLAAAAEHERITSAAQFASEQDEAQRLHAQQLADAAAATAARVEDLQTSHAAALKQLADAHALELASCTADVATDARAREVAAIEALAASHTEALAAAAAQHEIAMRDETQRVTMQWQREIADERARSEQTLQDALAHSERKAAAALDALQRELGERKGQAIVQCTAKWQRAVDELETRLEAETQAAYARGTADRESEWQRAAAQIKQTQQQELARVEHEAMRAVRAADERHALTLTTQLAQLRSALEAAHAEQLLELQREANERTAQQVAEVLELTQRESQCALETLQAAHDKAVAAAADDHAQAFAAAKNERDSALTALRESLTTQSAEALAAAAETHALALAAARDQSILDVTQATDALRVKLNHDHATELLQLRETLEADAAAQREALELQMQQTHDDAVARVQDDAERLIAQVEHAMATLRAHSNALESELSTLRSALEAADDALFDATEQRKREQQRSAMHVLAVVARATLTLTNDRNAHATTLADVEQQLKDRLAAAAAHEQQTLAAAAATAEKVQLALCDMHATLTTFKRAELVALRSASSALATELTIVQQQLVETNERKASLETEIDALQTDAARVETSLRDLLATTDSSRGGSLNVAAAAKKRRLNDEFDALLERAEAKRQDVRTLDATLAALYARRDTKESEMKRNERALVEILVQQQKRLLSLLAAARDVAVPAIAVVSDGREDGSDHTVEVEALDAR